jgi:hypothetical protein
MIILFSETINTQFDKAVNVSPIKDLSFENKSTQISAMHIRMAYQRASDNIYRLILFPENALYLLTYKFAKYNDKIISTDIS